MEFGTDPANPRDFDNDGIPDFQDSNSIAIDITDDGALTVTDLLWMQQHLSGTRSLSQQQIVLGDVHPISGDGEIGISDALVLQRVLTH